VIYPLACPYLLFFAAYVPDGWIRAYNRVGDYSYGVYIYAFPIQQALIELLPGSNGLENAALSTVVTIIFAILSWHLIEERALKLKQGCVGIARHLMSFGGRRMAHR
jgi:peptidoglycan/LPS O-acetylase OafA/YrhL